MIAGSGGGGGGGRPGPPPGGAPPGGPAPGPPLGGPSGPAKSDSMNASSSRSSRSRRSRRLPRSRGPLPRSPSSSSPFRSDRSPRSGPKPPANAPNLARCGFSSKASPIAPIISSSDMAESSPRLSAGPSASGFSVDLAAGSSFRPGLSRFSVAPGGRETPWPSLEYHPMTSSTAPYKLPNAVSPRSTLRGADNSESTATDWYAASRTEPPALVVTRISPTVPSGSGSKVTQSLPASPILPTTVVPRMAMEPAGVSIVTASGLVSAIRPLK